MFILLKKRHVYFCCLIECNSLLEMLLSLTNNHYSLSYQGQYAGKLKPIQPQCYMSFFSPKLIASVQQLLHVCDTKPISFYIIQRT